MTRFGEFAYQEKPRYSGVGLDEFLASNLLEARFFVENDQQQRLNLRYLLEENARSDTQIRFYTEETKPNNISIRARIIDDDEQDLSARYLVELGGSDNVDIRAYIEETLVSPNVVGVRFLAEEEKQNALGVRSYVEESEPQDLSIRSLIDNSLHESVGVEFYVEETSPNDLGFRYYTGAYLTVRVYDLTTGEYVDSVVWRLYQRASDTSPGIPVDTGHVLLEGGTQPSPLSLKIPSEDDYYLKVLSNGYDFQNKNFTYISDGLRKEMSIEMQRSSTSVRVKVTAFNGTGFDVDEVGGHERSWQAVPNINREPLTIGSEYELFFNEADNEPYLDSNPVDIPPEPPFLGETKSGFSGIQGACDWSPTLWYTANLAAGSGGTYTAGSSSGNVQNTKNITQASHFYPADRGVLEVSIGGTVVESVDLTSIFNESNRISGQSDYVSPGGYITLTNRKPTLEADGYSKDYFFYQVADLTVDYSVHSLVTGMNGELRVSHWNAQKTSRYDTNDANNTYRSNVYVDDVGAPAGAALDMSVTEGTPNYLSGVPFLGTDSFVTITTSASGVADNTYINNPLDMYLGNIGAGIQNINYSDIFILDPPNRTDVADLQPGSQDYNIGSGIARLSTSSSVTYSNVFGSTSSQGSGTKGWRIYTLGQSSTGTEEYYKDEEYRLTSSFDITDVSITSDWDSSQSLVTYDGGNALQCAMVANNTFRLRRPVTDYSSGTPTGPDYSSLSNTAWHYYRYFDFGSTFGSDFSVTVQGLSDALVTLLDNNSIKIWFRFPETNSTWGNNGDGWVSANGSYFDDAEQFCRTGAVDNDTINCSLAGGIGQTNFQSNRILMKIEMTESSTEEISSTSLSLTQA